MILRFKLKGCVAIFESDSEYNDNARRMNGVPVCSFKVIVNTMRQSEEGRDCCNNSVIQCELLLQYTLLHFDEMEWYKYLTANKFKVMCHLIV